MLSGKQWENPMSNAIEFIENWVAENIQAEPYASEEGPDPHAVQYAKQCAATALESGFSKDDLENAIGDDLISYMTDAINASADAEVERLASKDD